MEDSTRRPMRMDGSETRRGECDEEARVLCDGCRYALAANEASRHQLEGVTSIGCSTRWAPALAPIAARYQKTLVRFTLCVVKANDLAGVLLDRGDLAHQAHRFGAIARTSDLLGPTIIVICGALNHIGQVITLRCPH